MITKSLIFYSNIQTKLFLNRLAISHTNSSQPNEAKIFHGSRQMEVMQGILSTQQLANQKNIYLIILFSEKLNTV